MHETSKRAYAITLEDGSDTRFFRKIGPRPHHRILMSWGLSGARLFSLLDREALSEMVRLLEVRGEKPVVVEVIAAV